MNLELPTWLQGRATRGIAAQLQRSLPSGNVPYLSIKGGAFTLVDAAGNERKIGAMDEKLGLHVDACIIDSNPHVSKIYYAGAFDPNAEAFVPPTCFSDNGTAPSANAMQPQHKDCKTCPHNQWGSDTSRVTGKSTKACADVQKVAICLPGMGEMVFLLRIPPASLKHLAKYVQEVSSFSAGGRKVDVTDLVTRVYFQPGQVGILGFTAVGFVDAATAAVADKVYEGKLADQLVGKNDQPYTGAIGVLPAAGQVQGHALPPPQVPPQQGGLENALRQSIAQESAPIEPQKRRGRKPKEDAPPTSPASAPFMPTSAPEHKQPSLPANGAPMEDVPSFLQRAPEPPAPKPTPAFGMQAPAAAPDDMQARIAAVLAMQTGQ